MNSQKRAGVLYYCTWSWLPLLVEVTSSCCRMTRTSMWFLVAFGNDEVLNKLVHFLPVESFPISVYFISISWCFYVVELTLSNLQIFPLSVPPPPTPPHSSPPPPTGHVYQNFIKYFPFWHASWNTWNLYYSQISNQTKIFLKVLVDKRLLWIVDGDGACSLFYFFANTGVVYCNKCFSLICFYDLKSIFLICIIHSQSHNIITVQ